MVGGDVVSGFCGLAVVWYSEGLVVMGDIVGALVGAVEEGSGRSAPFVTTAAIIAAVATNPNETSPSLYFRILCLLLP